MARYEAGETLASIARTYDCSPPAISYVVSRSRARAPDAEPETRAATISEPQLIKAAATESAAAAVGGIGESSSPQLPEQTASAQAELPVPAPANPPSGQTGPRPPDELYAARSEAAAAQRHDNQPSREINGGHGGGADRSGHLVGAAHSREGGSAPQNVSPRPLAAAPPHTNGIDQRRTLHLSLGGGNGNGNGSSGPRPNPPEHGAPPPPPVRAMPYPVREPASSPGPADIRPAFDEQPARRQDADAAPRRNGNGNGNGKDATSFIDGELRARVDTDIAAFLAAFDGALAQDTQESRSALREATDRLLRAGARTRIELERLEARMPLPPRDGNRRSEPAWRHR